MTPELLKALTIVPVAVVLAALGTLVLMRLAPKLGAVARVTPDRWHVSGAVPRLAGPALLLAAVPWLSPTGVIIGGLACAIGCADDIRPLSARLKAVLLLGVAGLAAVLTGQWWVAPVLWGVANALNLLDHADGLAAAAAAGGFLGLGGDAGLAAAAGCAGFLLLNYPPARTFMGDSGSLTLGCLLAVVAAESGQGIPGAIAWAAIPLADATFVTVRRLRRGQRPWIGGTDHSGHVLLRAGVPARLLPPLYFGAALLTGVLLTAVASRLLPV